MKRAFIGLTSTPAQVWLGRVSPASVRVLCVVACLIGAASLVGALHRWALMLEQVGALESRLAAAHIAAARGQDPTRTPPPKIDAQQRDQLNEVVQQMNLPWADVLNALEQRTPTDVALTLIEPDSKQSRVRLQAEARRVATLVAYADALSAQPPFGGVRLLRHETNEQDEGRPARLTFEVDLVDPVRAPAVAQGAVR